MIGPTLTARRGDARVLYVDIKLPPSPPFPVDDLNDFATITFTVKRDEDDTDVQALFQKTKAGGDITIQAGPAGYTGTLAIAIAAGDLSEKGTFVWDVQVTTPVTTIISGNLVVNADVTTTP